MAVTFVETSVDSDHCIFRTTITTAESSQALALAKPLSSFGIESYHSTTGTFACSLDGSLDGTNWTALGSQTNTDGLTFVTGKPCLFIRATVSSMASSGSVSFIAVGSRV